MVIVESEVKKWGNSLGIIIPRDAVTSMKLKEKDKISIDLMIKKKVSGFGMFKGAKPFVREEDILDREF